MTTARKIIGLLIIAFIGIPILFGMIWAVGLTQTMVSSEIYSKLPREIIDRIPGLANEILAAAQEENVTFDSNTRAWLKAASRVDQTPKEVLEKTGILKWMENELTRSLETIGQILRGHIEPRRVLLDMRPLKQAFRHESFSRYLSEVLKNLPPCDERDLEVWQREALNEYSLDRLPACRPEALVSVRAIELAVQHMTRDIPDEVDLFENWHEFPRGMDLGKFIVSIMYALFIIPAVFILVGSWIGGAGKAGFFRWSGISTLLGGLSALGLALFSKDMIGWALHFPQSHHWREIPEVGGVVMDHMGDIFSVISRHLFANVVTVAEVVCVVGVVLIGLSFLVTSTPRTAPTPKP